MTVDELKAKFHSARNNYRRVTALRAEAEALRQSATASAIRYDKEHVQTSPMNYQEMALTKAVDADREADVLNIEGNKLRMELMGLISTLDNDQSRAIIIKYYFNDESIRDIEYEMDVPRNTVWRYKEDALIKMSSNA